MVERFFCWLDTTTLWLTFRINIQSINQSESRKHMLSIGGDHQYNPSTRLGSNTHSTWMFNVCQPTNQSTSQWTNWRTLVSHCVILTGSTRFAAKSYQTSNRNNGYGVGVLQQLENPQLRTFISYIQSMNQTDLEIKSVFILYQYQ